VRPESGDFSGGLNSGLGFANAETLFRYRFGAVK